MATILFAAAGAAVGAGFGGTILGLSGAVLGRAAGAVLGRVVDQSILGAGARAVETGRVDRFRLTGASEGAAQSVPWGRMRLAGQVIWAGPFVEHRKRRSGGGGKGGGASTSVTTYGYSVSLALGLCEGEILGIGRIWADGMELAPDALALRVYTGAEDQLPDPKIEAVEGAGLVPAYRGLAYVVFEDLDLAPYGNRVPQFSVEVLRAAQGVDGVEGVLPGLETCIEAVAMIPGTGEYALATTPVHYSAGLGVNRSANVHGLGGATDFSRSLTALGQELPACGSVSLVVAWFGDDLRCSQCRIAPRVEQAAAEGVGFAWEAGGLGRGAAQVVVQQEGAPVYGGTPADRAVIEAILALKAAGQAVLYYPFILMEQTAGNGLADPEGGAEQPALPWRGRITLSVAPGREGTPDRSAAAAAEVAAFFGTAVPGDFSLEGVPGTAGARVRYHGAEDWGYRRFILQQAWLARAAGGVDAFCIGSEMRGLTQIRGAGDSFPAVAALRALAADVRAVLGPEVKLSYAADWSEYAGYDAGGGDRYFHLDPLWADAEIDFIGIDNYLPLADWRDGEDHADAGWGAIHNPAYLAANVAGGEGYDWYYASEAHRDAQIRTPITDGAYGEPWVWRVKDLRGWWENAHHDRIGGVRQEAPSPWVPGSKPIWFTEYGCAAVDKGANAPHRFVDPRSAESGLPPYSNGRRDDLMQMQYLRAFTGYWNAPANNPLASAYAGRMVEMSRAHAWCWDARPWPAFPEQREVWSDGTNWARGHWLSGRATNQPLDRVVAEICARNGQPAIDVTALRGLVRGYLVPDTGTGRAALQPLMLALGFDACEREGRLRFRMRGGAADGAIEAGQLVEASPGEAPLELVRAAEAEVAGRVRLTYVAAGGSFAAAAVEAILPDEATLAVAETEMALSLTRAEAQAAAERWLAEARVARDSARLALPPSAMRYGPGDVLRLSRPGSDMPAGDYRLDRVEIAGVQRLEAVRVERGLYDPSDEAEAAVQAVAFVPPLPVHALFLDLPLMRGTEVPQAPHLAVTAVPWPGRVACYASATGSGYVLDTEITARAVVGLTETVLPRARPGMLDRGPALEVRLATGSLQAVSLEALLAGGNLLAIGAGGAAGWELFQAAEVALIGPGLVALSLRLRGQAGTEAEMPDEWPVGSTVVLIDPALVQIDLALGERDLARHYRIGPAGRPYDDASYTEQVVAFAGIGLRPYAPCHLRWQSDGAGGGTLGWVRRSRVDGDSWSGVEVPLGETREAYRVEVLQGEVILRTETVESPSWHYDAATRAADGAGGAFSLRVAQISEAFGPGPFERITIDD